MRTGGDDQRGEAEPEPLRFRPILTRIADGYRHDWKLLLGAGLLVFTPVGLLTSIDPLRSDGTIDEWEGVKSAALVLLILAQTAIALIGSVFYTGVVAAGEERRRLGVRDPLVDAARKPPYKRLVLADIAVVLVAFAGFVALILPGFVFLAWFALLAPVIEMEGSGVRAAFRRSRQMVRPHFWRVAGIVIPVGILQAILESSVDAGTALLGVGYLGELLGSIASNLLGAPLYALTVLALYFEIRARESRRGRSPANAAGP